jgi:hypothetical protein
MERAFVSQGDDLGMFDWLKFYLADSHFTALVA